MHHLLQVSDFSDHCLFSFNLPITLKVLDSFLAKTLTSPPFPLSIHSPTLVHLLPRFSIDGKQICSDSIMNTASKLACISHCLLQPVIKLVIDMGLSGVRIHECMGDDLLFVFHHRYVYSQHGTKTKFEIETGINLLENRQKLNKTICEINDKRNSYFSAKCPDST